MVEYCGHPELKETDHPEIKISVHQLCCFNPVFFMCHYCTTKFQKCIYLLKIDKSHLVQISVTPDFGISKGSGDYSSLAVIFYPLGCGASLEACDLASAGIGQVDRHQLTAGHPQCRMARCIIDNLQKKFSMVIIYFLCAQ